MTKSELIKQLEQSNLRDSDLLEISNTIKKGDTRQWQSKQVLGKDELCDFAEFVLQQHLLRWIPVEERLPDESMAKETQSKIKFVEVLVSDGVSVFTDNYLFETAGFVQYGKDVKFWMLRPEPPKK